MIENSNLLHRSKKPKPKNFPQQIFQETVPNTIKVLHVDNVRLSNLLEIKSYFDKVKAFQLDLFMVPVHLV